jgi:MFS family permease
MPALRDGLHLTVAQTGWVYSAMFIGLMAGYVLMTTLTALGGTRWGVLVSLAGATLGACASALAQNFIGIVAARVLTGIFVAGLLPAAFQAVREWFPSRMRPFAIGLFLAAGQLVGAVARPILGLLPHTMGWRVPLLVAALPAAIAAALCIFLWPARTPRAPSRGVSGGGITSVVMLAVGLFLTAPVTYYLWASLSAFGGRASGTMAYIGFSAAGACGAIVAGAIAWAMMSGGVGASRTRAVLLTVTGAMLPLGALLPVVAFAGGSLVWPLVLMALCTVAYEGWCTLLYSAAADALPARGVAIGAAIGALMLGGGEWLSNMASGRLFTGEPGTGVALAFAATSALALLVVALLAWLVRQEPEPAG